MERTIVMKKVTAKILAILLACTATLAGCTAPAQTGPSSEAGNSQANPETSSEVLPSSAPESSESEPVSTGFTLEYPPHMQRIGYTEPISLADTPEKIVCMTTYPILTLMGMGVKLTAVPSTSVIQYPDDFDAIILPSMMSDTFDLEQVVQLEPDLVIMPYTSQEQYGGTLEGLGIPVYYVAMTSASASAYDLIREQTQALIDAFGGHGEKAAEGAEIMGRFDALDEELAAFQQKTAGMSVFAITVSGDSIYGNAASSTLGCMLELCGLENVYEAAATSGHSMGALDMETSLSYDPDIMVICGSASKEENIAMMEGLYQKNPDYWDSIPAYKEGRVLYLPSSYVSTAGLNIIANVQDLMAELEPFFDEA